MTILHRWQPANGLAALSVGLFWVGYVIHLREPHEPWQCFWCAPRHGNARVFEEVTA